MKHYVLFYYVVADFLSRRAQYREKHLHLVQEANRRGHEQCRRAYARSCATRRRCAAQDASRNVRDPSVIAGTESTRAVEVGSDRELVLLRVLDSRRALRTPSAHQAAQALETARTVLQALHQRSRLLEVLQQLVHFRHRKFQNVV